MLIVGLRRHIFNVLPPNRHTVTMRAAIGFLRCRTRHMVLRCDGLSLREMCVIVEL